MSLRIITADARLKEARGKTTIALFGPTGVGKTFLLKSLPEEFTLCVDFEAGLKSVQDWNGDSVPVRNFTDALDLACLIGGINPAAGEDDHFNERHFNEVSAKYADLIPMLRQKHVIFVDSITDLTRQALAWSKTRPEAISERTGKPDMRAAYGLLAREVIGLLKHLQHAPGRTVIFVGILERVVDEMNRVQWQPQMDGGKVARELPGIVDQVMTLSYFTPSEDPQTKQTLWRHTPEDGGARHLVCHAGNPWGLPAKDRSGRLDMLEPADLTALLNKINQPVKG